MAHYRKAIDLLPALPESGARTVQEVNLQVALGYAYIRQLGWAADRVAKCLARAEELCNEIGDAPQLVPALAGMTVFYVVKGDQRVARAIAHQTLELARNSGDTGYLLEAHNVMASALFYSGRLLEVLEQCDAALGLYDPDQHGGHAFVYGQDPKVCALCWRAFSLIGLGCLDQALATAEQALECARALNHGPSMMWAWNANTAVRAERGDADDGGARSIGHRVLSRTRHSVLGTGVLLESGGLSHPKSREACRGAGADAPGAVGAPGDGQREQRGHHVRHPRRRMHRCRRSGGRVGGHPGGPRTRAA